MAGKWCGWDCVKCYALNEECVECKTGEVFLHEWQKPPVENWNLADIAPLELIVVDDEWEGGDEVIRATLTSLKPDVVVSREESVARLWAVETSGVSWFQAYDGCTVSVEFKGNHITVIKL